MDNTYEVGKKLVELCRKGQNVQAVQALYDPNIVSIEAIAMAGAAHPQRMQGIDQIKMKNEWWIQNHEIHGGETNGPFPHGDRFTVHFKFDVTAKDGPMKGKRMQLEETGLYTVKNGKIVQEEFFYHMG